ncbi:unnamed protein product [Adineta ricciae]|uniref:G-protein coupled receptors family 1 profile domain-containing protein n=1 Tax=Adineta ricciae TaxID=249248 RepID=A0A815Q7G0_ADIRI|nr:unnamed protein product [Adineta ricciae]CAF1492652.1 unnamed protein product [Adineta ricciae]
MIIRRSYQTSRKIDISILLSINAICLHILKSILQLINTNINTIKYDFQFRVEPYDLFTCQTLAYMFFSIVNALYWSCVLHAGYRFTRILYPKRLWLRRLSTYIYVFIPAQFVVAFTGMSPIPFVFHSIHIVPDEIYCSISMERLPSLIYLFAVLFCLPCCFIVMFYVYLVHKVRSVTSVRVLTRRHRRDYIVIRRIILILGVLSITSLPAVINLIFFNPNGLLEPVVYRIQWVASSVNSFIFIITLPLVNSQLYRLLTKRSNFKQRDMRLTSVRVTGFSDNRDASMYDTLRTRIYCK